MTSRKKPWCSPRALGTFISPSTAALAHEGLLGLVCHPWARLHPTTRPPSQAECLPRRKAEERFRACQAEGHPKACPLGWATHPTETQSGESTYQGLTGINSQPFILKCYKGERKEKASVIFQLVSDHWPQQSSHSLPTEGVPQQSLALSEQNKIFMPNHWRSCRRTRKRIS